MRFFILSGLAILSVALAEYPVNIPKCKNGDNSCLTKVANEIVQQYYSGQREINLLPLDPLHVKKMVLERDPSSPVNIDVTFSNFDIFGMKNMKIVSFSGLNADLSGRTVLEAKIPELRFVGQYKVDGRVLVLPVVGEGPCEVLMKNINFKYSFDLKPLEKNGQTYATIEHVKMDLDPENAHFQFDNLFNGDKALGDNLNVFINENSRDIYKEVRPGFTKAMGLVAKAIINSFFEKLPYAEYFE